MSLLAESLVEEWLNRAGFFTVRGAGAQGGAGTDIAEMIAYYVKTRGPAA